MATNQAIALVTGASKNIGLEIVRQLAQQGMTVILTARSQDKAAAAAKQLVDEGLDVTPKALDVTDGESVRTLADDLNEEFGRLDLLVNNAAAYSDWMEMPSSADLDASLTVMQTNLYGAWRTIQELLPLLRQSDHARILNVASGAGLHSEPDFGLSANNGGAATYGISKAALLALTVKFAAELADDGIRVIAAGPGLTATAPGMAEMGARPISEGAASIVWAATSEEAETGRFYRDGKALGW